MAHSDVVEAYARLFSKDQIECFLRQALENRASGVTITSLTYEAGGSSGQLSGKTEDIIAELNAALDIKEGKDPGQFVSHLDFSGRCTGT